VLCKGCAQLVHDIIAGVIPEEEVQGPHPQNAETGVPPQSASTSGSDIMIGLMMMGEKEEALGWAELALGKALSRSDWCGAIDTIRTLLALNPPEAEFVRIVRGCLQHFPAR